MKNIEEFSEPFEQALALLGLDPRPKGMAKKLAELEKQIKPEERDYFGDIWEGFMAGATMEEIIEMNNLAQKNKKNSE